MTRTDIPPADDERTMLTTFLDYARATAHEKCASLPDDLAARAPLPGSPLMTVGGLISHLHWVEYWWFQVGFLGEEDRGPWTDEDPDREMRLGAQIPLATLLADYEAQCARYRELVAAHDLDARAVIPLRDGTRGDPALDPAAPDRGDRPAQRASGHPARAGRRGDGRLIPPVTMRDKPTLRACSPVSGCVFTAPGRMLAGFRGACWPVRA